MIDLTPLDVRKKKGDFAKSLRGYETGPVDSFLDLAAERMEELVRENAALRDRVAEQKEELAAFRERERAMNDALISAQQLREELRSQASREAELALREARAEADRIGEAARGEAERTIEAARRQAAIVEEALKRAQATRVRFLRGFRAFVERQLEEIELEEERAREYGWGAELPVTGSAAPEAAE